MLLMAMHVYRIAGIFGARPVVMEEQSQKNSE